MELMEEIENQKKQLEDSVHRNKIIKRWYELIMETAEAKGMGGDMAVIQDAVTESEAQALYQQAILEITNPTVQ